MDTRARRFSRTKVGSHVYADRKQPLRSIHIRRLTGYARKCKRGGASPTRQALLGPDQHLGYAARKAGKGRAVRGCANTHSVWAVLHATWRAPCPHRVHPKGRCPTRALLIFTPDKIPVHARPLAALLHKAAGRTRCAPFGPALPGCMKAVGGSSKVAAAAGTVILRSVAPPPTCSTPPPVPAGGQGAGPPPRLRRIAAALGAAASRAQERVSALPSGTAECLFRRNRWLRL